MFLSLVTFFGLLAAIAFSKTKVIYSVHLILGGCLIGVKTIEKPSAGRPKGGHGHLIGVILNILLTIILGL